MAGVMRRCQTRVGRGTVPRLEVLWCLPGFLRKALLSEKLAKQFKLRSSVLKLLLAFTSAMACEWRQLLCGLGEDTFDAVLAMWEERPSPRQTHWLEYMTLMVVLHHPQQGVNPV
ncbi:hypothetical protein GWK47_010286 [Chionoecetes opilio]|uniref:Uncharacterized protein n=1 Tax=Chionoecetes opilio TaxID=41210 RepID=A0A8J4XY92_CHIOP|nr:hypothetical protein GWK47_010286 [Chionoecetes opilio]